MPFDCFYFIRNPFDSNTYYVQAIVYDVRTGDILATQNLTVLATNSRVYAATIQAPADSSGYGRNIVAIASVYTDSGYTTKSPDYEEQEQYFLVRAETQVMGGGIGIDYREVRDIVKEELGKAIKTIPTPEFPPMPFDSIFGAIGSLQREINRIPKDATDLTTVLDALKAVKTQIANLPEPAEQQEPDLSPVTDALAKLKDSIAAVRAEIKAVGSDAVSGNKDVSTSVQTVGDQLLKKIETAIAELLDKKDVAIPFQSIFDAKKPKPEKPDPMASIASLMSR